MVSYLQLSIIISKVWSDVTDIMKIAGCGRNGAIAIRNDIIRKIEASGKFVPKSSPKVVPTQSVIDYVGLETDYIFAMAEKEQKNIIGGHNNASLQGL